MAIGEKMPDVESLGSVAGFQVLAMRGRDREGIVSFDVVAEETSRPGTLRLVPHGGRAGLAERFLRDARGIADVSHPSLPAVQAVGEAPEGAYVVLDEARARTLTSVIEGGLPARQALRMLAEVAEALDVAHGAGVLHRRVRPENLVVGEWFVVRPLLVGFALGLPWERAGAVEDDQRPYAAPEEVTGEVVGPAADDYAFACTLFELILGEPPFGRSGEEAERGHLHEQPPRATDFIPDLPPAVDEVFARALAKEPDARHGSATALVAELSSALSGQPPADPRDDRSSAGFAAAAEPAPEPEPEPEPEAPVAPEAEPEAPREPEPEAEPQPEPEPEAASEEPEKRRPEPAVLDGESAADETEALVAPEAEAEAEPEGIPAPPWRAERPPGSERRKRERLRPPRLPAQARARLPLRATLVILACAALAGLLLGRAGGESEPPAVSRVSAGPLSLEVPEGWNRSGDVRAIGRLRLESPVGVAPGSGGGVVAGRVRGPAAAFDPRTLARRVGGTLPQATVVRLGRTTALRWAGVRAGNPPRPVTLFAVPVTGGAVAVACHGRSVPAGCGQTAASLGIRGVTPYDPVLAARWRERVRAVVRSLRGRRERGLARLSETLTSTDHARAADGLAQAHQTAIRDLARGGAPPQAGAVGREIAAALDGLARSYRQLARASRDSNAAAYTTASRAVARQDARLRRALRPI